MNQNIQSTSFEVYESRLRVISLTCVSGKFTSGISRQKVWERWFVIGFESKEGGGGGGSHDGAVEHIARWFVNTFCITILIHVYMFVLQASIRFWLSFSVWVVDVLQLLTFFCWCLVYVNSFWMNIFVVYEICPLLFHYDLFDVCCLPVACLELLASMLWGRCCVSLYIIYNPIICSYLLFWILKF